MFLNLNYQDKASTMEWEAEDADMNFSKAIFGVVSLVVGSYLLPLVTRTRAMEVERSDEWSEGYFAKVGMAIGGVVAKVAGTRDCDHVEYGVV